MRKILSAIRSNVQTNYGVRRKLLEDLAEHAPNVIEKISGAALADWEPRGLARVMAGGGLLAEGVTAMANPMLALKAIPALAATSPRLVGGLVYGIGAVAGTIGQAGPTLRHVAHGSRLLDLYVSGAVPPLPQRPQQ
jgi:hypothetical protein